MVGPRGDQVWVYGCVVLVYSWLYNSVSKHSVGVQHKQQGVNASISRTTGVRTYVRTRLLPE